MPSANKALRFVNALPKHLEKSRIYQEVSPYCELQGTSRVWTLNLHEFLKGELHEGLLKCCNGGLVDADFFVEVDGGESVLKTPLGEKRFETLLSGRSEKLLLGRP